MTMQRIWFKIKRWIIVPIIMFLTGCNSDVVFAHEVHKGKASYYSAIDKTDPFPHVTTANGQPFNENAMTAASWDYPFNTKVKVTNVDNGKSVVVTINDRGPSKRLVKKGRIIDLSKGAFEKIEDLEKGLTKVKVEIVKRKKSSKGKKPQYAKKKGAVKLALAKRKGN